MSGMTHSLLLFGSCAVFIVGVNIFVKTHQNKSTTTNRLNVKPRPENNSQTTNQWTDIFTFAPLEPRPDCKTLMKDFKLPGSFHQAAKEHSDKLTSVLKEIKRNDVEGHTALHEEQTAVYYILASKPFVKTVCETGFNAGHSTLVWLSAKNHTKVYSFDIGMHPYSKPMMQYLKTKYPGRLTATWGDSKKTLPVFYTKHPDVKCDVVVVDGGHSTDVASADFDNFRKMTSHMNAVILDDYPSDLYAPFNHNLGRMWEQKKRIGEVSSIVQCMFYKPGGNGHGFSLGRMLWQ